MDRFINGISITCFAASYLVVLVLEASRLGFRLRVRGVVIVTLTCAGLFAHTIYIVRRAITEAGGLPLSSWYDWCLMTAWIIAAAYLTLSVRRPETMFGVFLLPVVMGLIGLAYLFSGTGSFSSKDALSLWQIIHGASLLAGTAVVVLGFVSGVMFLIHSYRIKHKLPPSGRFKLPSLERLQWASERALIVSSALLLSGLLSGVILNLIRNRGVGSVSWSDPVVWSSGFLLAWLLAATAFNYFYTPARRGKKVAYLVVVSFVFLAIELGIVLYNNHAAT